MSIDIKLRNQILQMAQADQSVRRKQWLEVKRLRKKYPEASDQKYKTQINRLKKELSEMDKRHTKIAKEIVRKYGWPGKTLVGKKAASNAWLLVQHATHDIKFQKQCLALLQEAVKKGDAEKQHLALLIDRILVLEGKKQIYGTQFKGDQQGMYVPFPIKDTAHLDELRKEMNLEPFSVYEKKMRAT